MPYAGQSREADLERENKKLRYRIEELEFQLSELLGTDLLNPVPALNGFKFRMINLLAKRSPNLVVYEAFLGTLATTFNESAQPNTLKVHMVHARRALSPLGIEIETVWARGYRMPPESAAKWQALVESVNGKQEAAA